MAIFSKELRVAQKDADNALVWFVVETSIYRFFGMPIYWSERMSHFGNKSSSEELDEICKKCPYFLNKEGS